MGRGRECAERPVRRAAARGAGGSEASRSWGRRGAEAGEPAGPCPGAGGGRPEGGARPGAGPSRPALGALGREASDRKGTPSPFRAPAALQTAAGRDPHFLSPSADHSPFI